MSTPLATVSEILADLDRKPAAYLAAARRLAALPDHAGLTTVRMFTLSSFTFEFITPYFVVECARRGLAANVACGPFGQFEQQAFDPSSALYASEPTVAVIAPRVEDIGPELADGFLALSGLEIDRAIDGYVNRIESLVRAVRERSTAHVIVWNQPLPRRLVAGIADSALEYSQLHAIAEINRRLARSCNAIAGTAVFDAAWLASEIGLRQWFDLKLAALARMPLSGPAQLAVGRHLARTVRAIVRPPCKCLVVDLDNTLWGGVLGEDGISGIALGEDHPGSAFKNFQRVLRSYRDRGVLLAIASKNNDADVTELFANHRDMVLRSDDFAVKQIHWNDKAASLRAIADALNLGIDSLALFDDSPVERAWVREQLPAVTVIDVPSDPLQYIAALDDSGAFDSLIVTADDRARTEQYRSERQRRDLEATAGSVDDFLRALGMKIVIGSIDSAVRARVVQLLGKTNQFNVTTRRHSEAELCALLSADGAIGVWMRVVDRYGDSGLVGVGIAVREPAGVYRLDSFLMSCRVLGRKAEYALLRSIVRRARDAGASTLLGEFVPTKKNAPAARFFADAGFTQLEQRRNWWQLSLDESQSDSDLFEVVEQS